MQIGAGGAFDDVPDEELPELLRGRITHHAPDGPSQHQGPCPNSRAACARQLRPVHRLLWGTARNESVAIVLQKNLDLAEVETYPRLWADKGAWPLDFKHAVHVGDPGHI